MKPIFEYLLILPLLALSGCVTPQGMTGYRVDTDKVNRLIDNNVPSAVRIVCQRIPEARPIIIDVKVAICALTVSSNVTPADLKSILDQTGMESWQSDEAQLAANVIYGFYEQAYADAVRAGLGSNAMVAQFLPIMERICFAIGRGLNDGTLPP